MEWVNIPKLRKKRPLHMKIQIINGPNLNLLGKREPEIYGSTGFDEYFPQLQGIFPEIELSYYQSNDEGDLINQLQASGFTTQNGIILNAAGYSHTSIAIGDTVAAIATPVIEVHISNVYARESFRYHSYISAHAKGLICGFGLDVYRLAIHGFLTV